MADGEKPLGYSSALQAGLIIVGVLSVILGLALYKRYEWVGIGGTSFGLLLLGLANFMFHYNRLWKPDVDAQDYRDFMGAFGVKRTGRKGIFPVKRGPWES